MIYSAAFRLAGLPIVSGVLVLILSGCSSSSSPTASEVTQGVLDPAAPIVNPTPTPSPLLTPTPVPQPLITPTPQSTPTVPVPTPQVTPTLALAPQPTSTPVAEIEQVVLLTNLEREYAGLAPLQFNSALTAAAQSHATDMAVNDYFSHTSPAGSTLMSRVAATGYAGSALGENLARGRATAAAVVEGWMGSPGHRANILDPGYRDIGVGYAEGASGPYWVQVFGRPR